MYVIESVFEGAGRPGFRELDWTNADGELLLFEQGHKHLDSRLRLELDAFHPDDATVDLEDRPCETRGSCNLHVFKDFLHLARAAGVVDSDSVAGHPGAEDRCFRAVTSREVRGRKFDSKLKAEGWRLDSAGDGHSELGCNFRTVCSRGTCGLYGETQLAMGPFGAKALSQLEFLTGATVDGQRTQGFCGGEIERGAERRGGMAKEPALESRRHFGQTRDVDG